MMSQSEVDEAYRLALELCSPLCRDYHMTRPYLVASGVRKGPARDAAVFVPLLTRWVMRHDRVLIAGAADQGLLELLHDTLAHLELSITVADRCETPLTLNRRAAARRGIAIETAAADLTDITARDPFDVVIMHAILPHIEESRRTVALQRVAALLTTGGRVLAAYPVHQMPIERAGISRRMLSGLAAQGIALPEPAGPLIEAIGRVERSGEAFDADSPLLAAAFAEAGLHIVEREDSVAGRKPRRYVVARRN